MLRTALLAVVLLPALASSHSTQTPQCEGCVGFAMAVKGLIHDDDSFDSNGSQDTKEEISERCGPHFAFDSELEGKCEKVVDQDYREIIADVAQLTLNAFCFKHLGVCAP